MLISEVQSSNALIPIEATLLGIVISLRLIQPSNARSPISVTESGITDPAQPIKSLLVLVAIMALQLLRESYTGFLSEITMLLREKHPVNESF